MIIIDIIANNVIINQNTNDSNQDNKSKDRT